MRADIPLLVWQVDIVDTITGVRHIRIVSPYNVACYGNMECGFTTEAGAFASIYREAMNSNTPVFQFLCFYKILERVQEPGRLRHIFREKSLPFPWFRRSEFHSM